MPAMETRVSHLIKRVPPYIWKQYNQEIKVGDVVLVHDDSSRTNWRMVVVEELSVGGDGLVRAARQYSNE